MDCRESLIFKLYLVFPIFIISQAIGIIWSLQLLNWIKTDYGGLKKLPSWKKGDDKWHALFMSYSILILGVGLIFLRFVSGRTWGVIYFIYINIIVVGLGFFLFGIKYGYDTVKSGKLKGFIHLQSFHGQASVLPIFFILIAYLFAYKYIRTDVCCTKWIYLSLHSFALWSGYILTLINAIFGMYELGILIDRKNFNGNSPKVKHLEDVNYLTITYGIIMIFLTGTFNCEHDFISEECLSEEEYIC